ncbi:MAG TPA: diguanylate cyclase [Rhodocyclaceae bacterium]|nr:diguanylate cyclase [Rhodocyclaceae bacterium]
MSGCLYLLCCHNFQAELRATVAAEGWPDVVVADFPARCGHPPLSWDELRPLLGADCTQVVILGRCCLQGMSPPPEDTMPVRQISLDECFHLVAGATLVSEALARGAYLMTPTWLEDWRAHVGKLGFNEDTGPDFFRNFARELVLLDTGVTADAPRKLEDMATALSLPASRIAVGIDYTRLLLARLVAEWKLEQAQRQSWQHMDQLAAMDFLGRLPLLKDETETVVAIENTFRMLFAPETFHYVRYDEEGALGLETLPPSLCHQVTDLQGEWAWTATGNGFLLRLHRNGRTLGVLVADRFAFPEFRERYLALALSVAGVCALAIENSRTYARIKTTEVALRRSEHSLKMAQAIAHVGHWEWDQESNHMQWSDEIYRILGLEPAATAPNREAFFTTVHPEDRAALAERIDSGHASGGFDLEYRIIRPDGSVRVVHSVGELVPLGNGTHPKLIGTVHDVTASRPVQEVLGVIQDITERKAIELRLAEEAHTDALTGCANRRHFMEQARAELARVIRYGGALSVLMLDIDHFKTVNDRYGHPVGDLALQTLAHVCRGALREADLIGRLGGEEFAVLLPETGCEKAQEVAERLRQDLKATEIPIAGQPPFHITASIGVATRPHGETQIEEVLRRADQALYDAKETGRDRVVVAQPHDVRH